LIGFDKDFGCDFSHLIEKPHAVGYAVWQRYTNDDLIVWLGMPLAVPMAAG
jgi:hypothetical protein